MKASTQHIIGVSGMAILCSALLALAMSGVHAGGEKPYAYGLYVNDTATGLVFATDAPAQRVLRFHVRISTADGRVAFEDTSAGGFVEWLVPQGAPEGHYKYEAVMVIATDGSSPPDTGHGHSGRQFQPAERTAAGGPRNSTMKGDAANTELHRVSGSAIFQNGWMRLINREAELSGTGFQSEANSTPGLAERLLGATLNLLVPEAHAFQTFTEQLEIEHANPVLHLNDTDDTSDITDWFIGADDSDFRVSETNVATPLSIEKGVPSDSFYMESGGDIGFGTNIPLNALHIKRSNPSMRFENSSSGQTWQLLTADRIQLRDVTAGTFPFIVTNGAPDASTCIRGDGNVGMGTCNPATPLHIQRSDGNAEIFVEETSGTAAARVLYRMYNNGAPILNFRNNNASANGSWTYTITDAGGFRVNASGSGAPIEMDLFEGGDMSIGGTLTEGSSRAIKDGIVPVDHEAVLAKLQSLEIAEWSYEGRLNRRHMGPMAEDFHAVFGLGPDNKHIAPKDLAGVALAAAKALEAENAALREKVAEMDEIKARLTALESRVAGKH